MPTRPAELDADQARAGHADRAADTAARGEGRAIRSARREHDLERGASRPESRVAEPRRAAGQALAGDDVGRGLWHRSRAAGAAAGERRDAPVPGEPAPAVVAQRVPGEPGPIAEEPGVEGDVADAEPAQERLAPGP